jgi:cell wall-associated NlpC family hydrolase
MRILAFLSILLLFSCQYYNGKLPVAKQPEDSTQMVQAKVELSEPAVATKPGINTPKINTGATKPEQVLAFAKTLVGVPYRYGSSDPVNGFDCSGFITYVFNHFNITVPRSSTDFTNYDTKVDLDKAKPGDLILFTGTDSTIREVGHMGIITSVNNDVVEFIHSSSGKANGVTITPLNRYYLGRFVKVIRVF